MDRLLSRTGFIAATIVIAAASLISISAQSPTAKQDNAALPDGPGKEVLKKSCSSCHDASVIITKPGHTDDDWADILNKMIGRGAVLSDEDGDTLMDYLSTNFGPTWKGKPPGSPATAGTAAGAVSKDGKTATAAGPEAPAASSAGASADSAAVNVNKASAQELQSALGISASEAESIVRHREQFGSYKTWEDVSSVPGITAEKIKQNQKRLIF